MAAQACAASTTSVGPAHPRVSADSREPARLRRLPWTREAPLRVIRRASADSVAAPPAPLPPRGQAPRSPLLRVAISASTAAEAVSGPVWFGCMHMHLIPILRKYNVVAKDPAHLDRSVSWASAAASASAVC
uniref:Uncharacterized protein n=1 Tax=Oryza meridionalis TaxID=40149 RepID=A0A0E0F6Q3_9ORYZ